MLKGLVETGKLHGYNTDFYNSGKVIAVADSKEEAKEKIINAYLKHGYSKNELSELEVWKIEDGPFNGSPDVLEIWQKKNKERTGVCGCQAVSWRQ